MQETIFRCDVLIQYLSTDATTLNDLDDPIPVGVLIYSKDLREFRMGEGQRWSETPVFLSIADVDLIKTVISDLAPRVEQLETDYADLFDENNKFKSAYMPSLSITDVFVVTSEEEMLALSDAEQGDVAIRSDISRNYILKQSPYSELSNWILMETPIDSVLSVNGLTGTVVLNIGDIPGLQAALDAKQATLVSGTNIKTVGGTSIVGSGNIAFPVTSVNGEVGDVVLSIGDIENLQSTLDGKALSSHTHTIANITNLQTTLDAKQATLVSGTNIKTINGVSILGSGNLTVTDTTKLPLSGGTMTGAIARLTEPISDLGVTSGTITMNLQTAAEFVVTANGNLTFNVSNVPSSQCMTIIVVINGYGVAATASWGFTVRWPDGEEPGIDGAYGRSTVIVLNTYNSGTFWFGNYYTAY